MKYALGAAGPPALPGAPRRHSGRLPTLCGGFVFVPFLRFVVLGGPLSIGPNLKKWANALTPKFAGRPGSTRWLPTLCGGFVLVPLPSLSGVGGGSAFHRAQF